MPINIKHRVTGKILRRIGADNLREADLREAKLREADLQGADLRWANLRDADLRGANLRDADLQNADLQKANLRWANLRGADLRWANLRGADLRGANLRYANLWYADLRGANLRVANLRGADLRGADLRVADLQYADLQGADLQDADLPIYSICPEEGAFIAFKKLGHGVIAKILIPNDAKRTSNLVGRKCRASKIKVLEFLNSNEIEIEGWRDHTLKYSVGKEIFPDKYDDDIRLECTHGIHFFMTKKEAEQW